jgi:signal recognition particle subunit SRP54
LLPPLRNPPRAGDADVNFKIAKDFTDRVKDKALGEKVLTVHLAGAADGEIVKDELAELMGGEEVELNLSAKPTIILIAGLQGSGKTTFSASLRTTLRSRRRATRFS